MAIQVRTESKITGDSEHVVTEEGLRAAGVDPKATDPDELKVAELVKFQGWLQANDAVDLDGASEDDMRYAARLFLGLDTEADAVRGMSNSELEAAGL